MSKQFIAPSGAEVMINIAPWSAAKALKKAVEKELSTDPNFSFSNSNILAAVLAVDSSDTVDAALWPCLIKCTRNKEKITESTFDDAHGRADYYDIVAACVEENLRPLVEGLSSKLASLGILTKAVENPPA